MTGRTVHFVGDAQAWLISRLYVRLIAARTGEQVVYRRQLTAPALPPAAPNLLFVQQSHAIVPAQWTGSAQLILFPLLECRRLWPFARATEQGYRDLYLDHGRNRGLPADRIVADYLDLDVADVVDLAALAEEDRLRRDYLDQLTGLSASALPYDSNAEQLFLAPRVPAPRLIAELAQALFARAGAEISIERLRSALRLEGEEFFRELPVHPSIITAIGLAYFDPEPTFATIEGPLTFGDHSRVSLNDKTDSSPTLGTVAEPLAEPIMEQARHLVAEGKHEIAEAVLAKAMPHLREAPALPEMLAELLLGRSRWSEAAEAAEQAMMLAPDRDRSFRNMAIAALAMKELAPALAAAGHALSLDPFAPDNRNITAEILETLGRRAEAIAILERGLRLDAYNTQSLSLLGHFNWRDAALDQAADAFSRALTLEPGREDIRSCLAEVENARCRR